MSPSYSPLGAVSVGVYAALNVSAVTTLATGGVFDDVPQQVEFPFVLFEVAEAAQWGGFGTKAGVDALPEIDLRVHVYSQYQGFKEAQAVMVQVIKALVPTPTVSGYSSWAIFHDETTAFGDEVVAGQKCKELVARFRLYVEES